MNPALNYQDITLKALANEINEYYLAGGTALARVYFGHRESYDLDFFTKEFSTERIKTIVQLLSTKTAKKVELSHAADKANIAKQYFYNLIIDKNNLLKIDFVEDFLPLIKPFKVVDGINVLSLEDIYLRKIYAVTGTAVGQDRAGGTRFAGGRQEAKDLYDLYVLSQSHENISSFADRNCDASMVEGLVAWFHRFKREPMKIGLGELKCKNQVELYEIEKHFRKEIEKLLGDIT